MLRRELSIEAHCFDLRAKIQNLEVRNRKTDEKYALSCERYEEKLLTFREQLVVSLERELHLKEKLADEIEILIDDQSDEVIWCELRVDLFAFKSAREKVAGL